MKHTLLFLAAFLGMAALVSAQETTRFNPDRTWNTVRAEFGFLTPIDAEFTSGDALLSLSYTRRFAGHWGWRTGFQYAPEFISIQDHVGVPVAIVFRSGTVGFKDSLRSAAMGSATDIVWGGLRGADSGEIAHDALSSFLFFLFRRFEGFAGVTPGYLIGNESIGRASYQTASEKTIYDEGVLLNNRFTLTADAGLTLSIPIWRFSLDVTPAIHYLLTNNCSEYRQAIDPLTDLPVGQPSVKPVRWQFSLTGGISFLF